MAKIVQGSRGVGGLPVDCDLDNALLEYRREHNIFEVGDFLVVSDLLDEDEKLYEVDRIGAKGGVYDKSWNRLHLDYFRHATDEEIKAGHRL